MLVGQREKNSLNFHDKLKHQTHIRETSKLITCMPCMFSSNSNSKHFKQIQVYRISKILLSSSNNSRTISRISPLLLHSKSLICFHPNTNSKLLPSLQLISWEVIQANNSNNSNQTLHQVVQLLWAFRIRLLLYCL
jgi:hypothetical protein